MKRTLITGGAGFIGSHLAEALLARGERVTIIDNLSTGRFENINHLTNHPNFQFAIDSITIVGARRRLARESTHVCRGTARRAPTENGRSLSVPVEFPGNS